MKTTLDIPDSLYRAVKSRSAGEGLSVRGITIMLYGDWLARPDWKPAAVESTMPGRKKSRARSVSPLTRSLAGIARDADGESAKDEYFSNRYGMTR